MFSLHKTYDLALCLLGYWVGKKFGGWGGGIVLAFAGLWLGSWGWDWLARNVFQRAEKPSPQKNFAYGATSAVLVAAAAFVLWGK
jgi:hypothetical protein